MPFIVNVPIDFSAIKYFDTEMKHLMLVQLVKKCLLSLLIINYCWRYLLKCLHDAKNVIVVE